MDISILQMYLYIGLMINKLCLDDILSNLNHDKHTIQLNSI